MKAIVKYVHGINTCAKDVDGPHEVEPEDFVSAEAARRCIKRLAGHSVPLKEARRTEDGGWVFFPLRKRGSIWWSVALRLDVDVVQAEAAACQCRSRCKDWGWKQSNAR